MCFAYDRPCTLPMNHEGTTLERFGLGKYVVDQHWILTQKTFLKIKIGKKLFV